MRLPIPPQRHVKLYGVCPSHCAPDAFTGVFKPRQRPFSARSCSLGTRDLKSPALCGSARAPERLRSPLSHPCAAGEGTCTLPTSCPLRCGKYGSLLRKKHRLETMPFAWRRHPDLNRGVKVLQTFALPLGYGAKQKQCGKYVWSGKRDSNPRHSPWQGDALPLSYSRIINYPHCMVEAIGIEPMTLCL